MLGGGEKHKERWEEESSGILMHTNLCENNRSSIITVTTCLLHRQEEGSMQNGYEGVFLISMKICAPTPTPLSCS